MFIINDKYILMLMRLKSAVEYRKNTKSNPP